MNFSGPLIRNKQREDQWLVSSSLENTVVADPIPSAVDMYKVKDDLFADLQNTPLFSSDSLGNIQERAGANEHLMI